MCIRGDASTHSLSSQAEMSMLMPGSALCTHAHGLACRGGVPIQMCAWLSFCGWVILEGVVYARSRRMHMWLHLQGFTSRNECWGKGVWCQGILIHKSSFSPLSCPSPGSLVFVPVAPPHLQVEENHVCLGPFTPPRETFLGAGCCYKKPLLLWWPQAVDMNLCI